MQIITLYFKHFMQIIALYIKRIVHQQISNEDEMV